MKKILEKLFDHETLNYDESNSILKEISAKKYNDEQISSFLTVYKMRMPTVEEIEGFRDALIDLSITVDFNDLEGTAVTAIGNDIEKLNLMKRILLKSNKVKKINENLYYC